jgi:hypothetical protein
MPFIAQGSSNVARQTLVIIPAKEREKKSHRPTILYPGE